MPISELVSIQLPEALAEGEEIPVYATLKNLNSSTQKLWIFMFDKDTTATLGFEPGVDVEPGQTKTVALKYYDNWRRMPAKDLNLDFTGGYLDIAGRGQNEYRVFRTIPLLGEPAPKEGIARLYNMMIPNRVPVGETVQITLYLINDGLWPDSLWVKITDKDTGQILTSKIEGNVGSKEIRGNLAGGPITLSSFIMPSKNLRLEITAGHGTTNIPDTFADFTIIVFGGTPTTPTPKGLLAPIIIGLGIIIAFFLLKKR